MKIEVTKWKVMATVAAVAAIAICAEWVIGFRLGEEEGTLVEFLATIGFAVSAWLLFTPLDGRRGDIRRSVCCPVLECTFYDHA